MAEYGGGQKTLRFRGNCAKNHVQGRRSFLCSKTITPNHMKARLTNNSGSTSTRNLTNFWCKVLVLSALLCAADTKSFGQVIFFDDFNGPTLDAQWQASLPNMHLAGPLGGPQPATYLGAPTYSFQTLDGSSVLRMGATLDQL